LKSDVVELLDGLGRVLEPYFAPAKQDWYRLLRTDRPGHLHLQQTLLFRLDTLKEGWVRKLKLVVFSGLKSVIGFRLGHLFDEGFEVTPVPPDLEPVKVEDIGDGVVEEAGVVGHDD